LPSNMAVAATQNEKLAFQAGQVTAQEAKAIGVNVIFAPTLDININPDNPIINSRSYGEDPETVSRFSQAFIEGCQSSGVIATAKHFPGHGATEHDSHITLPVINKSKPEL